MKIKYISGRKEFPFVEFERRLEWLVDIKCGMSKVMHDICALGSRLEGLRGYC